MADLFRRKKKMDPFEIEALAGLRPLFDPVFRHLIESALHGRVDVYFAAVPRNRIRPFDPDYNPARHPVGAAAIADVQSKWARNEFSPAWVYPKDSDFILSDDYIIWEALRSGEPEFVPCWILGKPDRSLVEDLQGPVEESVLKRALGLSTDQATARTASAKSESGRVAVDFGTLRRQWKAGAIAIGIDRSFARRFYTDLPSAAVKKRIGERDILARVVVFGAFLLAPAALLVTCVLAAITLKWLSVVAIPIVLAIYAAFQSSSSSARSGLAIISWLSAISIVALAVGGPSNLLGQGMICTFLVSLWASRFTYVTAVRSLRALVLRNARAYDWLRTELTVRATETE